MIDPEYEIEPERYEWTEPQRYRFDLPRRDFLRIVGATAGLVVVVSHTGVAQESGAAGQGRADAGVSAWLHIDERGRVTVYTGKVEIGQNIRTSLAQAVADELRVPIDAIAMVMADTDRTPFDAGTFGSQSTPRMGRQLARAAATAREMLIDSAAARWQVDRASLRIADGHIAAADGRTLTFGELTSGQRLAGSVAADPPLAAPDAWGLRGQSVKKVDGRSFVTGRHEYVADMRRPGLLHGRIVRPPTIGGTLASIDDSGVRAFKGAAAVRDGDFVGIVAPDERTAARAAAAVKAEWRPRTGQPSSATVYEHLKKTQGGGGGRGSAPFAAGDAAGARAKAARVFEASYRIPYIAHVPLEPRAAVAEWTDGKLTVWTATQRPFGVRAELASAFRIPEDRVRVIVPDMGCGYGGKHTGEVAIEAARLARRPASR